MRLRRHGRAAAGRAVHAGVLPQDQRRGHGRGAVRRRRQRGRCSAQLLAPLFSHQVEGDFRVGPTQIAATRRGLAKLRGSLAEILRLVDLANWYDKPIAPATWEAIRAAVPTLPDEVTPEASKRFLSLLGQPARLATLLRTLHEMGVLEKIIPAFAHARCLLQFNEYHKYTVDEHCMRAVERATAFRHDAGPLGRVYRPLKRKRLLHLALLIHDLGKGYPEDHSEVGLRIADETARRLGLADREAETLKFLVHKHLLMSHLAFRRDTSDEQLVVRFAVEVGSPEVLQMLFVLTAADLAAVGPGVLNGWKVEVLTDLYHRTMQHLAGEAPATQAEDWLAQRRSDVLRKFTAEEDLGWFRKQLAALPATYLLGTPPEAVAADLRELAQLAPGEAVARGRYLPENGTIEYRVGTYEPIAPGVFHKLTGALASQGLQILSAEINTLADGLVLDRFFVVDPDYAEQPPPERLEAVSRSWSRRCCGATASRPCFAACGGPASSERGDAGRTADAGPHRQQHVRPLHDPRRLRGRPHGAVVHDRPHALRAGTVGVGGEDRHVSGPGRRRVLRHRSGRREDSGRRAAKRHPHAPAGGGRGAGTPRGRAAAGVAPGGTP